MTKKLWLTYFWFFTITAIYFLLTDSFFKGLLELFGLTGLYGYIQKEKWLDSRYYSIWIVLSLAVLAYTLIMSAIEVNGIYGVSNTAIVLFLILLLQFPFYYGVFKYIQECSSYSNA